MTHSKDDNTLLAGRFGPDPSAVAEIHRQRAAALQAKIDKLPAGAARDAATAAARNDPSRRLPGSSPYSAIARDALARARREHDA